MIEPQSLLNQHEAAIDAVAKEYPAYSRAVIESAIFDQILEVDRVRCRTDLFFLAHDVLGYSDLTESIHRPLCQLVESVNPLIISLRDRLNAPPTPGPGWLKPGQHPDTIRRDNKLVTYTQANHSGIHTQVNQLGISGATSDERSTKPMLAEANSTSGVRGGGGEDIDPHQKFYKNFQLPSNSSINKLLESKIIQFNPEARTRLFLLFRGAFKSTIITIAHTIQLMLIWPDIRILIASHKKEGGSQKFLGSIKDHFIRNKRFRRLFPEFCPKPNSAGQMEWGTSEMVTLPNRSSKAIYPEATIEIAGNTTDVTGRHYNYLKIDDIVTRESVTNESMLEKTEEFNALLTFLFDQPEWGIADYSGTCYHFADLYAKLRDSDQITKFILPIVDDKGKPTIPERFTTPGIEAIKNHPSQTSYQFSCQYMLNPIPLEDQTFRPEWWKRDGFYYDKLPEGLKISVFVDPANTQRKESDYTALMTIGIDSVGDWWLIDIIRDKLTLDQRAKLVLKILKHHGIHQCHYESVGFMSSDIKAIKEIGSQADWYIGVVEIKASRQSKEDRIRGLQYLYEQGKVHWPRKYVYHSKYHARDFDMVDVLRKELWMFPSCEKDDLADCHSFALKSNMTKGSTSTKASETGDKQFEWLQAMVRESKKKQSGKFNGHGKGFNELPSKKSWR